MSTRIVCISDVHNRQEHFGYRFDPPLPPGSMFPRDDRYIRDLLIIAGDVTMSGTIPELEAFLSWAKRADFKHKVMIAGNHDFCFENKPSDPKRTRELAVDLCGIAGVTYLEDSGVELCGLKIWGSPWQPWFHDWAFNLPRGPKLAEKWAKIPEDTDVLITHGPPAGIRDVTQEGESVGCQDLRSRIDSMNGLKLHVFGHIHEGAGKSVMGRGMIGQGITAKTVFVNASVVNRRYECVNQPIELDLG